MDIFEYQRLQNLSKQAPLAARMRPATLDSFIGQEHIIGPGRLLRRAIQADKLTSLILHGPPGTGKTTLAKIIAGTTSAGFVTLNATTSGIKELKQAVEDARTRIVSTPAGVGRRTIIFIDEIHRFNKAQQDALLPHVENGTLILVGVTTENPYFEVNKALVSRSLVYSLHQLRQADIEKILRKALADEEHGLGRLDIQMEDSAIQFLADIANGDARAALNALELAAITTPPLEGRLVIDIEVAQECIQKRAIRYERDGDNHYDTISAFIKSMRGSDPDAAIYYLARMLYAGEAAEFIARRLVIAAAEDVGNADPHALLVADAAARAVAYVGLPECKIILSQATAYIAAAPKSNSALGVFSAEADVRNITISSIPTHIRDTHTTTKGEKREYLYPHDYPGNFIPAQYLPDELLGKIYYNPSSNGVERRIKESLEKLGKRYD